MSERTNEGPATSEGVSHHLSNMMCPDLSACEVRALISRRAYELYKKRDPEIGDELSDWLEAEGEVVSMLLAEPQETGETKVLNLPMSNRTRAAKSASRAANVARRRASRWSKRKNALNGDPV